MPPKLSWSDVRFQVLSPSDLAPWARSLRELERAITYPIDDGRDHFYIDHGADYHSFYSQMGAPCYFLVATVRDQPVGLMAGVVKRVVGPSGDERRALYAGDLKVAAPYRGTGLVAAMMRWVLLALARDRDLRRWDFAFGAAMRGARGDVTRTTSGAHPLKLMRAISRQSLWFVTPQQLISLRGEGPDPPACPGVLLSPDVPGPLQDTDGRKDMRLVSTGERWPLVHVTLSPSRHESPFGHYLRQTGAVLAQSRPEALACFALDERLTAHVEFLRGQGLLAGAAATIYAMGAPWTLSRVYRHAQWVHIATSEI